MNITNISDMDLMINKLETYKYTYEGSHRTDGSYCLTFIKSLKTMFEKDPEMYEEARKLNSAIGEAHFNDGYTSGCKDSFSKGLIAGVAIAGLGVVTCKFIKHKINKNKLEEKKENE